MNPNKTALEAAAAKLNINGDYTSLMSIYLPEDFEDFPSTDNDAFEMFRQNSQLMAPWYLSRNRNLDKPKDSVENFIFRRILKGNHAVPRSMLKEIHQKNMRFLHSYRLSNIPLHDKDLLDSAALFVQQNLEGICLLKLYKNLILSNKTILINDSRKIHKMLLEFDYLNFDALCKIPSLKESEIYEDLDSLNKSFDLLFEKISSHLVQTSFVLFFENLYPHLSDKMTLPAELVEAKHVYEEIKYLESMKSEEYYSKLNDNDDNDDDVDLLDDEQSFKYEELNKKFEEIFIYMTKLDE